MSNRGKGGKGAGRDDPCLRLAPDPQDAERDRFLQLADRLTKSKDTAEQKRIKEELARLTLGD